MVFEDDAQGVGLMTKAFFGSNGEYQSVIETPDWLISEIVHEFGSFFDPCPVDPREDGLLSNWHERVYSSWDVDCVYVNPPYTRGQIAKWVEKCRREQLEELGVPIVLLIPSYTDTAYFHDFIYQKEHVEIRFFKGRIQFKGYDSDRASFPSMLVIFHRVDLADSGRSLDESQRPFPNSLTSPDLLPAIMDEGQRTLDDFAGEDRQGMNYRGCEEE